MDGWRENVLEDDVRIGDLIRSSRRVAVLGIKTERQSDQAAFYVPRFLVERGVEVVPVPVYYPEVAEILGRQVYRSVSEVPGAVDIVDVFRRPQDVPAHLDDLLAKKPRAVWLQLGIRNDAAVETLARAGIQVVQDRCLMVEWRRHAR
jgi:predicted CoA-binding protein